MELSKYRREAPIQTHGACRVSSFSFSCCLSPLLQRGPLTRCEKLAGWKVYFSFVSGLFRKASLFPRRDRIRYVSSYLPPCAVLSVVNHSLSVKPRAPAIVFSCGNVLPHTRHSRYRGFRRNCAGNGHIIPCRSRAYIRLIKQQRRNYT
jgi:hypothetical protein